MKKAGNYRQYYFKFSEFITYMTEGALISAFIVWIFYKSPAALILSIPGAAVFLFNRRKKLAEKRRRRFNIQFKDAITAMSAALIAGYSLENSITESNREMRLLYGEESDICRELNHMTAKLKLNIPIENLFMDLAERSDLEDIKIFAQIINIAKRTGGNMVAIIKNTAETITQKVETKQEIEVLISAKKMEQRIMNIVPIFMIAYISITSPGFFDVMYETIIGRIIMTTCLALYFVSYYLSERIANIEI